jgi:hypothetical protein
VLGNTQHALRVLGGTVASERRGQGGVHGRARGLLPQGINLSCRSKPSGEVTRQEMVGGVLALLGCPRWAWRWPGQRGVMAGGHCEVGAGARVLQGWRSSTGGRGRRLVEREEEGFSREGCLPQAPPFPLLPNYK